ncbi:uncharacterized protein [Rutidosis leptorrhynchoides]|uniref:uncharacterized protein n=1 Tax=Rutidosis leptorrhynchoides TaxID=125765 RepID=UPI003A99A8E9
MSQCQSQKRKRAEIKPNNGLSELDYEVFKCIKNEGYQAISEQNLTKETKLSIAAVRKCIKTLQVSSLIKEIPHAQFKGKHYIVAEYTPAENVTGGLWYTDGKLDTEFIEQLKDICFKTIKKLKVATVEGVNDFLNKNGLLTNKECSNEQISEILRLLILDNVVVEVKSNGVGEYHSIPVGNVCYRCSAVKVDQGLKLGVMASIPCGVCPRISKCTPDGLISPSSCVYYKKWFHF